MRGRTFALFSDVGKKNGGLRTRPANISDRNNVCVYFAVGSLFMRCGESCDWGPYHWPETTECAGIVGRSWKWTPVCFRLMSLNFENSFHASTRPIQFSELVKRPRHPVNRIDEMAILFNWTCAKCNLKKKGDNILCTYRTVIQFEVSVLMLCFCNAVVSSLFVIL